MRISSHLHLKSECQVKYLVRVLSMCEGGLVQGIVNR